MYLNIWARVVNGTGLKYVGGKNLTDRAWSFHRYFSGYFRPWEKMRLMNCIDFKGGRNPSMIRRDGVMD